MRSRMQYRWFFTALACTYSIVITAPSVVSAQTALPTGEEIRERYVEALGGRAVLQAPKSSLARGTFDAPAQGLSGEMEIHSAAPNKMYSTMTVPGVGQIRTGFNGEVGWSANPVIGPMILEGAQLEQLKQQADFYAVLHPETHVVSFEPVGQKEFEGKTCYEVKVTTKWDEEYTEFYDIDTGLLAGSVRSQESPMGPIEATNVVVEYQDFGGIMVPVKAVQRAMGIESVVTITSVEYDVVDEAVFELPADIKALLEAQPKDTTAGGRTD
ncbi:MAG: hypothetical protein JSW51_13230 [Gemmatimonadota bacterium]|nr:MAG: hypothetical protein JSW51_13230 [Gemmatimonadota bacterium]